jgi:hypothetical protein
MIDDFLTNGPPRTDRGDVHSAWFHAFPASVPPPWNAKAIRSQIESIRIRRGLHWRADVRWDGNPHSEVNCLLTPVPRGSPHSPLRSTQAQSPVPSLLKQSESHHEGNRKLHADIQIDRWPDQSARVWPVPSLHMAKLIRMRGKVLRALWLALCRPTPDTTHAFSSVRD